MYYQVESTKSSRLTVGKKLFAVFAALSVLTLAQCFEQVAATVGKFDSKDLTIGWIRNTLDLEHLALSENLRAEIEVNPSFKLERRSSCPSMTWGSFKKSR